ncbi:MAG: sugar transporter [Neisseria sp.]|nr:sugar transporter [Neisseria sp.]
MPQNDSARWLSVLALAVGAFVFNTTEFIPIALLSDIGAGFGMPPAETGIMLTVYAWVVALMSLPLMLLTRQVERKRLLLVLFAIFIGGHLLSFAAWRFDVLLASRVAVALTHAVFWSITAALAVRIAPEGKGNQALSLLSTGTVLSMVLGIPLGRLAGGWFGWRVSLLLIGIAALITALMLAKNLPQLPSRNSGSLASLPQLMKNRKLLLLYGFTVITITAHFAAYSYIEPFALQYARFSDGQVTLLLLCYGAAGFLGSYVFGKWFDRHSKTLFFLCTAAIALAMLLLAPLSGSPYALYALAFLWSTAFMSLMLAMVSRVLHFAAEATDVGTAIHSALFNLGIGSGALLGRAAVQHFGLPNIGYTGASLAALSVIWAWLLIRQPGFANERRKT